MQLLEENRAKREGLGRKDSKRRERSDLSQRLERPKEADEHLESTVRGLPRLANRASGFHSGWQRLRGENSSDSGFHSIWMCNFDRSERLAK